MIVDAAWVAQTADHMVAVMEESRSTWQIWHVRAEAQRQVRTIDLPAPHRRHWSTGWSTRYSITDVLPSSHRLTTSRNPSRCGASTVRRSTPWPAPSNTPRSGSWMPRPGSSPQPDDTTGRPSTRWRWISRCWRWRPTAPHWLPGRQPWSAKCAPPVRVCSWRSPRRRREDHRHARPPAGLDPRRWSGGRPGPVRGCGRRPGRADRHPRRHPRQTHLVTPPRRPARLGGGGRAPQPC